MDLQTASSPLLTLGTQNKMLNLPSISSLESNTTPASASSAQTSGNNTEFNQVLLQLLGQLGSSGSSDSALSLEMLIIPLLQKLVEKSSAVSPVPAPVTSAVQRAEPKGSPVQGPISQGSHTGHIAIDFAVVVGTPVHATMDGKVVYSGWNNDGYGNLVIVENGSHRTYYAHNSSLPLAVGTTVHAGDIVAYSGNTGHSTGPHVHYETRVNGVTVDPTSSLG
jgi:murein DD-endopeptidase MepM/ murein hydrolase activator NlpD